VSRPASQPRLVRCLRARPRGVERTAGVGLHVDDPTGHLDLGALVADRADDVVEGRVVQHPAVDQPRVPRPGPVLVVVVAEALRRVAGVEGPRHPVTGELAGEAGQADRLERAREARRGPRGERQRPGGAGAEGPRVGLGAERDGLRVVAFPVACPAGAGGHHHLEAVQVRRRHEQLQRHAVAQQVASRAARRRCVHTGERVVQQAGQAVAPQRRHGLVHVREQPQRRQDRAGAQATDGRCVQERTQVALLHPQPAQTVLAAVAGQRLGQEHAVDPTRRGARDHVDRHRQPPGARRAGGQLVQHRVVGVLGVVPVDAGSERVGVLGAGRDRVVVGPGRADQLVQLLGHAVHVDRERHPAVADQRQSQLGLRSHVGHLTTASRRTPQERPGRTMMHSGRRHDGFARSLRADGGALCGWRCVPSPARVDLPPPHGRRRSAVEPVRSRHP